MVVASRRLGGEESKKAILGRPIDAGGGWERKKPQAIVELKVWDENEVGHTVSGSIAGFASIPFCQQRYPPRASGRNGTTKEQAKVYI